MSDLESLTIYLIEEEHEDDFLKLPVEHKVHELFDADANPLGHLYVSNPPSEPPDWVGPFKKFTQGSIFASGSRPKGLWVLRVEERTLAIAFGDGRFLLHLEFTVPSFGLRVALNAIDAESIHVLRRHRLDTQAPRASFQAVSKADFTEFGVDVERDLLRGVTARSADPRLGKRIDGADSLRLRRSVSPARVPQLLRRILELYVGDSYRQRFAWVDSVQLVRSKDEKEQLLQRLQICLSGHQGEDERLYLAVPDLTLHPSVEGFRYSPRGEVYPDLAKADYLAHIGGTELTIDKLKRDQVCGAVAAGEEAPKWRIFDCINFETVVNGRRYILADGHWFSIDLDFERVVKERTNAIPLSTRTFLDFDHSTEGEYNQAMAESSDDLELLDQKFVYFGGGKSKFEVCDLLSRQRELIHVKRYNGSSSMNHLFAQGYTTARLLKRENDFRSKASALVGEGFKFPPDHLFSGGPYEVVFAIVSSSTRDPADALPFFSRLTLDIVSKSLADELGFSVRLAKINDVRTGAGGSQTEGDQGE